MKLKHRLKKLKKSKTSFLAKTLLLTTLSSCWLDHSPAEPRVLVDECLITCNPSYEVLRSCHTDCLPSDKKLISVVLSDYSITRSSINFDTDELFFDLSISFNPYSNETTFSFVFEGDPVVSHYGQNIDISEKLPECANLSFSVVAVSELHVEGASSDSQKVYSLSFDRGVLDIVNSVVPELSPLLAPGTLSCF